MHQAIRLEKFGGSGGGALNVPQTVGMMEIFEEMHTKNYPGSCKDGVQPKV